MNFEDSSKFCTGRYAALLQYYDRHAIAAKRGYNLCALYILFVSVSLTPIQALGFGHDGAASKLLIMILSPTLALVAGVAAHFRFHENWISYRATWDALNRELSLRDAQAGPYRNTTDRDALFVERVEALAGKEAKDFYSRQAAVASRSLQAERPMAPLAPG